MSGSNGNHDQRGWFHRWTGQPFYTVHPGWARQRRDRLRTLQTSLDQTERDHQQQLKIDADLGQQLDGIEDDIGHLNQGIKWSSNEEAELRKQQATLAEKLRQERTPRLKTPGEVAETVGGLFIGTIPVIGSIWNGISYGKGAYDLYKKYDRYRGLSGELQDVTTDIESHEGFQEATHKAIAEKSDRARLLLEQRQAQRRILDNLECSKSTLQKEKDSL